jgi:hypothetical protein
MRTHTARLTLTHTPRMQKLLLLPAHTRYFVVGLYFISTFQHCCRPLKKSVLMDYTRKSTRGRWNSLDSVTRFGWSGSAVLGGYIIDRWDYGASFLATAVSQVCLAHHNVTAVHPPIPSATPPPPNAYCGTIILVLVPSSSAKCALPPPHPPTLICPSGGVSFTTLFSNFSFYFPSHLFTHFFSLCPFFHPASPPFFVALFLLPHHANLCLCAFVLWVGLYLVLGALSSHRCSPRFCFCCCSLCSRATTSDPGCPQTHPTTKTMETTVPTLAVGLLHGRSTFTKTSTTKGATTRRLFFRVATGVSEQGRSARMRSGERREHATMAMATEC